MRIPLMMKSIALATALTGLTLLSLPAKAQTQQSKESQDFAICLIKKTSSIDRLELVQWIYGAMSLHPALNELAAIPPYKRDIMDQRLARLVTRLLTQDCRQPFQKLIQTDDAESGIELGFTVLGEIAMEGLLEDPKVSSGLIDYVRYLDEDLFLDLLEE